MRGADTGGSAISWGQSWFGACSFKADTENWVLDPFFVERILLLLRDCECVNACNDLYWSQFSSPVSSTHVWMYLNKSSHLKGYVCNLVLGQSVGLCHHWYLVNTLRPRRIEQHFADDIFKRIFFNENLWISIKISLKFVPKGPINNIPTLVQIMAWRLSGDKPLFESMMISLPTHICVTQPQWVKILGTPSKLCGIKFCWTNRCFQWF